MKSKFLEDIKYAVVSFLYCRWYYECFVVLQTRELEFDEPKTNDKQTD